MAVDLAQLKADLNEKIAEEDIVALTDHINEIEAGDMNAVSVLSTLDGILKGKNNFGDLTAKEKEFVTAVRAYINRPA